MFPLQGRSQLTRQGGFFFPRGAEFRFQCRDLTLLLPQRPLHLVFFGREADDAHRVKLEEFLRRFEVGLEDGIADIVSRFWLALNGGPADVSMAWASFRAGLPELSQHGARWADRLARHRDLASGLVEFCEGQL